MRKRVILKVVTSMLLASSLLSPCYATAGMSVWYDNADNTFTVNGDVTGEMRKWVNIAIVPGMIQNISPDCIAGKEGVVLKSVQTNKNGNIDLTIDLSDTAVPYQRYVYYIYPQKDELKGYFAKINAAKLTKLTADVNGAKTVAELKTILEIAADDMKLDLVSGSDKGFMAKYVLMAKPNDGYTEKSLINTYFVAEGLDTARPDFSLKTLLEEYTEYVGKDYLANFEELDGNIATKFSTLFAVNRGDKLFETEYKENLFVAKCVCSESCAELQKTMLAYFTTNNIDCSVYNSINNSVYREKVFENLYKSRTAITDIDDLVSKFKAESKTQKKAENSGSGNGGGGSITPNKSTTRPAQIISNESNNTMERKTLFSDTEGHWATDYIATLYDMGIVDGREDGSFGVDEAITRAEFAKMIVSWLKVSGINDVGFSDVDKDTWYYEYVVAAAENGLINGDNGKFRPNDAITREDVAVIMYRAIGDTLTKNDSVSFADGERISNYATTAVASLSLVGIINGYENNTFAPKNSITRAEAAKIIVTANKIVS